MCFSVAVSCCGRCNQDEYDVPEDTCYCDDSCTDYEDCCNDYEAVCEDGNTMNDNTMTNSEFNSSK